MARLLRDIIDAGTPTAAVDWAGAICALESGRCHAPELSDGCCAWPPASARASPWTCRTP